MLPAKQDAKAASFLWNIVIPIILAELSLDFSRTSLIVAGENLDWIAYS